METFINGHTSLRATYGQDGPRRAHRRRRQIGLSLTSMLLTLKTIVPTGPTVPSFLDIASASSWSGGNS